jgi:hypothetical protein
MQLSRSSLLAIRLATHGRAIHCGTHETRELLRRPKFQEGDRQVHGQVGHPRQLKPREVGIYSMVTSSLSRSIAVSEGYAIPTMRCFVSSWR